MTALSINLLQLHHAKLQVTDSTAVAFKPPGWEMRHPFTVGGRIERLHANMLATADPALSLRAKARNIISRTSCSSIHQSLALHGAC